MNTESRKTCLSLMRRPGETIRIGDDVKVSVRGINTATGEVILEIHTPDCLSVTTPTEPAAEPARCTKPVSPLEPKLPPSGRPTLSLKRKDTQP